MTDRLWAEVFLNIPLHASFFYGWTAQDSDYKTKRDSAENSGHKTERKSEQQTAAVPPQVGTRAHVTFGKRKMTAFIVKIHTELPSSLDFPAEKIKPLGHIIDEVPLFTREQVELALWMEDYYLCSRGEALSAMLPLGKKVAEFTLISSSAIGLTSSFRFMPISATSSSRYSPVLKFR